MNKFKINRDPFYKDTLEVYKTKKDLVSAGWFDDKLKTIDYSLNLITTPIEKIKANLKHNNENKPIAILLTTGGFAPLHQGHLDMMSLSKKNLENQGYFVAGGYFSPSHDSYVLKKYNGSVKRNIYNRIEQIYSSIKNSDWLMLDCWEALFVPKAINFTEVISRTDLYLKKHLDIEFKLFYVFGSDNYDFHKAFVRKGYACCIERRGFENIKFETNRLLYIPNVSYSANESSKKIRDSQPLEKVTFDFNNEPYLIREDFIDLLVTNNKIKNFKKDLEKTFQKYSKKKVIWVNISEQQSILDQIPGNIINLDKATNSNLKVNTSRIFESCSYQHKPESLFIEKKKLDTNQSYTLVDDDIASGQTMKLFKQQYPDLKILKEIGLSELWFIQKFNKPYKIHDIVDLRDFIFGCTHGGLMIKLPNDQLARVPYIFPFVNLNSRAKIHPTYFKKFSKKIIDLNLQLFKGSNIKIKDCDPLFINFWTYQGFSENLKIYSLLKDFKRRLFF